MKVKLIKCKKSPAQSDGEQVKKRKHFVSSRTCTIKELRNSISVYGIPIRMCAYVQPAPLI